VAITGSPANTLAIHATSQICLIAINSLRMFVCADYIVFDVSFRRLTPPSHFLT
jgi:hypothetical protein